MRDSIKLINIGVIFLLSLLVACAPSGQESSIVTNTDANGLAKHVQSRLILGSERANTYLPMLKGKKVGLVLNQTSNIYHLDSDAKPLPKPVHLADFLLSNNIEVQVLFAPEHGIRGNKGAGEHIQNGKDSETQLPIVSIYGPSKLPNNEVMNQLDVIVFDIQDVGTRFYTYISSMHYMMQAAAKHDVEFIVLDRPNPNGEFIDGPVLDMAFQSFVGMHPIPVLHGLTVGELAKIIVAEKWIEQADNLSLTVVNMLHYNKNMAYELPISPSPNLPNYQAIRLYPSLCFFEPTAVSIGRGTDFPFQVTGHNSLHLGDFAFTPVTKPYAASIPKLMDVLLNGKDLRSSNIEGLDLSLFVRYRQAFQKSDLPFYTSASFMDKLAGTDQLRIAIDRGDPLEKIRASWQSDLANYKEMIKPHLLYPTEALL